MAFELARYRCPRSDSVWDVWLEDGKPEERQNAFCPVCLAAGVPVLGRIDRVETALWDPDDAPRAA
jgi:hypothetical protein